MKKCAMILGISMLLVSGAHAASRSGSQCGLIDFADDLSDLKIPGSPETHFDARDGHPDLDDVTQLREKQLIQDAKEYAKEMGEDDDFSEAGPAVEYLLSNSDSIDIYDIRVKGEDYTIITAYPGDNAMGTIFLKNSSKIVAQIHDSEVVCK